MIYKKNLFFTALLFCFINLGAQESSDITLRVEPGVLLFSKSENFGLFLNVEPTIKISKNKVIGMRFAVALNPQKFKIDNNSQFFVDQDSDNAVISFTPTFDYYLNDDPIRPYLGLGLGYYVTSQMDIVVPGEGILDIGVKNQLGFLLRGGFKSGKTRFGLEYNLIPKADIEIPNVGTIGVVKGSYFGVNIGLTIGGGRNSA